MKCRAGEEVYHDCKQESSQEWRGYTSTSAPSGDCILPGVPVDIEADEDGVHIRKHVPTCHFCGTVDDVKTVCGIEICRGCAEKIMEEFKG